MPNPPVEPERPAEPAQKLERIPTPPVEPEKYPYPLLNLKYLPNLKNHPWMRRMEPPLAPKRLKQEPSEGSNNIILWVPKHHPLMTLGPNGFLIQPTHVHAINK
ncbi:hypothetical protein TNCV_4947181 [Trichonephila clavipes]|nr:hypothetical protein TNCV_4947181 [Trichonephila clavipes]